MSLPTDPTGRTLDGRATWREWLGLVVLLLPMLVLATDLTVLFFAMPSLSADLEPGAAQALWITHAYGFLIAGFLITMGRLGDRVGRRRLLLIGAAAFAVLSMVAAWSTNPEMLIVARALLGVAGATLMPSTYSLLRTMFADEGQRRFAIAVMFSGFSAGAAIGPLLGGVLLEYFWWGSVFLVNVPVLALLLLVGRVLLPEHRESGRQGLDLISVGLSLTAMLALIYGVQELAAGHEGRDTTAWPYAVLVVLGLGVGMLFVRRQRRFADPLLDLALFRHRRFATALGIVLLTGVGMVGVYYLFTQYLQWVVGYSPLQAGLATVPFVVLNIVGAMLAPLLVRRLSQRAVVTAGLALAAGGLLGVAVAGAGTVLAVIVSLCLLGAGQGAVFALLSDTIISSPPADQAGSAAAMQEVSGELGTALGIAAGGTVGVAVYGAVMADRTPDTVPDDVAQRAAGSVHDGVAAAEQLPVGAGLLEVVRDAFTAGMQVHAGVGAVVVAAGVVVVAVLLRDRPQPPPPQENTEVVAVSAAD